MRPCRCGSNVKKNKFTKLQSIWASLIVISIKFRLTLAYLSLRRWLRLNWQVMLNRLGFRRSIRYYVRRLRLSEWSNKKKRQLEKWKSLRSNSERLYPVYWQNRHPQIKRNQNLENLQIKVKIMVMELLRVLLEWCHVVVIPEVMMYRN